MKASASHSGSSWHAGDLPTAISSSLQNGEPSEVSSMDFCSGTCAFLYMPSRALTGALWSWYQDWYILY